ncbi:branched-chain amino acid ABC transporter substrate-binding protein, partial [Lactobacillus sp. XV13L]|nr:branched-chain amino acid ABC transporter substrate-binding protein [Lactobacillus sp. XV13L]
TAIENEKSDDSVKIAAGLSKIKDFDGVTGSITVNKTHDPEMPIAVEEMTNGKVSNSVSVE